MTDRQPSDVRNLDIYGSATLEWSRVHDLLAAMPPEPGTYFLGTIGPDGRPHAAGVGAVWSDGDFYIVSGPKSRKSRDLAANPACTLAVSLRGMDLTFEGDATRVVDAPTLERIAALYRSVGWPATVEGDAFTAPYSAPSAGPPPWYLYRLTYHTVVSVATAEPNGATRWRFER
jgi:hypothetical protein